MNVPFLPTCGEVHEHLTEYLDGAMPLRRRLAYRIHLLLCHACSELARGLRALPGFAKRVLAPPPAPAPPEAQRALQETLRILKAKPKD